MSLVARVFSNMDMIFEDAYLQRVNGPASGLMVFSCLASIYKSPRFSRLHFIMDLQCRRMSENSMRLSL